MTRKRRKSIASLLTLAVFLPVATGCYSPPTDVGSAEELLVEASDEAKALGVHAYRILPLEQNFDGARMAVLMYDEANREHGQVTVVASETRIKVAVDMLDKPSPYTLERTVSHSPDGVPDVTVHLSNGDVSASFISRRHGTSEETLEPVGDVPSAEVLAALGDDPRSKLLLIVTNQEEQLLTAVAGLGEPSSADTPAGVGTAQQSIHNGGECVVLLGTAGGACITCLAGAAWTGPVAALICGGICGVLAGSILMCLLSSWAALSNQYCINNCAHNWATCGVDNSGHSCWTQCDEYRCDQYHGSTAAFCSHNPETCNPPCTCYGRAPGSSWCDSWCCYTCTSTCSVRATRCRF